MVAQAANMGPSDARVIHQRPALIQELDWRPQYQSPSTRIAMDPVLEVALTFYNDQLFRITITYDQSRTDGMTNADVIDAVSATYGLAVVPATPHAPPRSSPSSRTDAITIARWANGDRTLTLSRGACSCGVPTGDDVHDSERPRGSRRRGSRYQLRRRGRGVAAQG